MIDYLTNMLVCLIILSDKSSALQAIYRFTSMLSSNILAGGISNCDAKTIQAGLNSYLNTHYELWKSKVILFLSLNVLYMY